MRLAYLAPWIAVAAMAPAVAGPTVVDDSGASLSLSAPARRIVSLAPHVTEMLYAAGAGDRIVGAVKHSDYPEAAKAIVRVGDSAMLDLERIVSLKPDLIAAWFHGNSAQQLSRVAALGIPVFQSQPRALDDIGPALVRFGTLAGTEDAARRAAAAYTARLASLRERYAARPPVRVFFQVWSNPLLTINGEQLISDVIRLCGGHNVFEQASLLVPSVDAEAVAAANPEVVVATGTGRGDDGAFDAWRKLPSLRATAAGNLVLLRTDALGRHSPRVLDGALMLCEALERVRAKRTP